MTTEKNSSLVTAPMWWDGGERAITAREKATIEEHGPSCFTIALVPATPSARWAADGLPDPHAGQYACERAALTLGTLTDDELANAVYLHGNEQPSMADLVAGKALSGIVYLTAAKDRIRWLSRALAATCKQPLQVGEVQGDARAQFEAWNNSLQSLYRYNLNRWSNEAQEYRSRHTRAAFTAWQAALAARQPGEMSAEASQMARDMVAHCIEHRLCMGMDEGFASFDPDVEHPFVQELRGFVDGARQPGAQERVAWASTGATGHKVVAMPGLNKLPYGDYDLYAAPPAQGIDLEKARDEGHDGAIRYVLGYLNGVGDWGSTQYVEILNACGRERIIQSAVQDGELEFTGLGRWVAERGTDKDRALIDQRDAAPGVGNGN